MLEINENMLAWNNQCGSNGAQSNCLNKYRLRFRLYSDNICGNKEDIVQNRLVLDYIGRRYEYIDGTAKINCQEFDPNFCIRGLTTEICASKNTKELKFTLKQNKNCEKVIKRPSCISDSESLRLSEIMKNLKNLDNIKENCREKRAELLIEQSAILRNTHCGQFVICSFDICNCSDEIAQKVLFKDVFPCNTIFNEKNVFLNNEEVCRKQLKIKGRSLLLKLSDIAPCECINIKVVLRISGCLRNSNKAQLSYVSNAYNNNNVKFINIDQKVSNIKCI